MDRNGFAAPRALALIDTAAIAANLRAIRQSVGGRTAAVVKADAYGHSIPLAVPALVAAGCDLFAVATLPEALAVRRFAPRAEILLLGYTPVCEAQKLLAHRITQAVFSYPYAAALSAALSCTSGRLRVHIKVDGGMHRLGFAPHARDEILAAMSLSHLEACGIFTHLPSPAEQPGETALTLSRFLALRATLPGQLFTHAAAGAALTLRAARLDGVRAGLSLYGYPSAAGLPPLARALSLHAPIVQIHVLPRGTQVGYGGAFVTARPSRIGTLPVGYADGLCRALGGMEVTLTHGGKRYSAPLCGRICMDYCMIDLTDTPAEVGDDICLIEDAAAVAARLSSIPYEVLTAIGKRVWRQRKGADVDCILRSPR